VPKEAKKVSFWFSSFALILYTVACGAVPVYHQISGRGMKPVLTLNLDSVYVFAFLLGTGTIVAIAGLNRRIAALEEKNAGDKPNR
jgi:hypothetical protein